MLFFTLTSEYEFLMNAHDVATKTALSKKQTEEDVNILDSSDLMMEQYFVGPDCRPMVSIGAMM